MKVKSYCRLLSTLEDSAQRIKEFADKVNTDCHYALVDMDYKLNLKTRNGEDDIQQEDLKHLGALHSIIAYIRLEADKMRMALENMEK